MTIDGEVGGEEPEEGEADTQPTRRNKRGGGGHHRPWPLAQPTTTNTPHQPFFSSAPPPTAACSLVHPALNLLALILVLLSFYLTWQIRARALRSASSARQAPTSVHTQRAQQWRWPGNGE